MSFNFSHLLKIYRTPLIPHFGESRAQKHFQLQIFANLVKISDTYPNFKFYHHKIYKISLQISFFAKNFINFARSSIFRHLKMKIHHEGTNILILFFIVLLALNILVWLFLPPWIFPAICSAFSLVVYSFVFNFFRCPVRVFKGDSKNLVVSSVDGKVVAIERVNEPEFLKSEAIMLSVFMSPLNVHANWFPTAGVVEYVAHHKGRFLSAYLPKSSTENERATIGMATPDGNHLTVRQIAGAMARRIVTYAKVGQFALIDEHLGFIKFGSRVDIYLPTDVEILVKMGQTTHGGLTPIARLKPKA